MPSEYFSCTEDNAKQQALHAFTEEMGTQVKKIEEAAALFKVNAAVFNDTHNIPTRRALDRVIASSTTGLMASDNLLVSGQYESTTPSEDVLESIGLPTVTDQAQLEEVLSTRHNLHVVNGQIVAPGNVEVTAAKLLYKRLDYNLLEFQRLLDVDYEFPFILVAVHSTKTDGDLGLACAPGRAAETVETVLGINKNLSTLAAENNVLLDDITPEIYWISYINTSPNTVRLLRGLSLTPIQIGLALTEGSSAEITTYIIEEPEAIVDLLGMSDADLDRLLKRDNLKTVNPEPTTQEVVRAAKDQLGSSLLDKNKDRISTMQTSGLLLAQTLDIKKFAAVELLGDQEEIVNQEVYDEEWVLSLEFAVEAVQAAFDALAEAMAAVQEALNAFLGPILSTLTLIENLLNTYGSGGAPLLQCLFGAMSVDVSLSTEFFTDLFGEIDEFTAPLLEVLGTTSNLMAELGAPTCLVQSLMSALLDAVPENDTLECISLMAQYGFEIYTDVAEVPSELWTNDEVPEPGATFQGLSEIAGLMTSMVSEVQTMLRDTALWAHNIALNLDLEAETRSESCNPETITGLLSQLRIEASV